MSSILSIIYVGDGTTAVANASRMLFTKSSTELNFGFKRNCTKKHKDHIRMLSSMSEVLIAIKFEKEIKKRKRKEGSKNTGMEVTTAMIG